MEAIIYRFSCAGRKCRIRASKPLCRTFRHADRIRWREPERAGLSEAVLNLSPKAHTKTDTSSQEKLFGEIQNSF